MSSSQNKLFKQLEQILEWFLWKSRLMVLLAVFAGLFGALGLFILGSREIIQTIMEIFPLNLHTGGYQDILIGVIGAVDLFLIGIVLIIFSFGVYELFVSKLDEAHLHSNSNILDIETLDELKNKVLKVVVVALIVTLFKSILLTHFTTPVEILYFALSILAVALAVYFIHRKEEGDHSK